MAANDPSTQPHPSPSSTPMSSDDAISLAVPSRRQELSDAIMGGFEDRGWQWSDEQLIQGLREMFHDPVNGYSESGQNNRVAVSRRICRVFGDSQVMPASDKVLGGLAKSLATEIERQIKQSDGTGYAEELDYLTQMQLPQEIDALSSSKEVFPIPIGYNVANCPMLDQLHRLVSKFQLVSYECRTSIAFQTVLWIIAMASTTAWRYYGHLGWARRSDPTQIYDYLAYREAEKEAQVTRAKLRARLSKLSPEVRAIIFNEIAIADYCRNWSYFEGTKIAEEAREVVEMLGDLDPTPQYQDFYPYEPRRKEHRLVNLEKVADTFQQEVEEVITKGRDIVYCIDPSNGHFSTRPNAILSPSPDLARGRFVQDLQLRVHIEHVLPEETHFPSFLFNAQKYIPRLKEIFPGLKTIQVEVWSHNNEQSPDLLRLSATSGELVPTTMEEEMGTIVQSILKLGVARKFVCYNQFYGWGYAFRSAGADPTRSMTILEFVQTAMKWEGLCLQICSVEGGLADVREAIVKKLGVTEPDLRE